MKKIHRKPLFSSGIFDYNGKDFYRKHFSGRPAPPEGGLTDLNAKDRRGHRNRIIAIVACAALVITALLPLFSVLSGG